MDVLGWWSDLHGCEDVWFIPFTNETITLQLQVFLFLHVQIDKWLNIWKVPLMSVHVCEVFFAVTLQCFQELFCILPLRSWVVARSHEPAEKAGTNEDRARCAAMLGVLWPRAVHKRRRRGRPSYQERWEDRLYRASHHGTTLEDMSLAVMQKWWRLSWPLDVSEAQAERIAGTLVAAVQHGTPSTPEQDEPGGSPSERVKIHRCAEVKDWFLDLVAIQRERHFAVRSKRLSAGCMNVSVPKRWKYSDEKLASGSGSEKMVPDAVYTVCCTRS